MSAHYDALETRSPEQREAELFAALPAQVAHTKSNAPHFSALLAGVDPRQINSRDALAKLPITRKSDLVELQRSQLPFGGLSAIAPAKLARLFVSPGPIYDAEGKGSDFWRTARVMFAAGFRCGDVVHNTFSYHLTPAGSMFETGAHALGCAVIPAGTGQTELQIATIAAFRASAYAGTPSFLKLLIEKADEIHGDLSSIDKAIVSGEAFLSPARELFKSRGIAAYQAYGSADLGMIAYESVARQGLILDEKIIVEIVRPGTGEPIADGEIGEVVVTTFNRDYPLIRFATGDLSSVLAGISPCGRTNTRIKGWLGRADQTTKVRGMFVHPHQVDEIVKRHPMIVKARLTVSHVDSGDAMMLSCEATANFDIEVVKNTMRDITKLRGDVQVVAKGSLANDGKVIEDLRSYA